MTTGTTKTLEEVQIKQLIGNWTKAVRAKDIKGVMACYAPGIVSFDMIPPLQFTGTEEYRENWEQGFTMCNMFDIEFRDMTITAGEEVGYCHRLNRMTGTMNDGTKFDTWVRWTACFRKINGKWLITHEHISVPMDMESGKALQDLKPE